MRYLSEDDARRIGKELDSIRYFECSIEDRLLDECKELPEPRWQTKNEFMRDPVDGWCWINLGGLIDIACVDDGNFYWNDASAIDIDDEKWDVKRITHVMSIPTPEAPK